jgi:sensor domain CHASE-containing protein
MRRLVKDFVEVKDYRSLDQLIERLQDVRASLPEGADAEIRMRGDDVFGRHISISFSRPQTDEEAACDARYAAAYEESLKAKEEAADKRAAPRRKLRIAA